MRLTGIPPPVGREYPPRTSLVQPPCWTANRSDLHPWTRGWAGGRGRAVEGGGTRGGLARLRGAVRFQGRPRRGAADVLDQPARFVCRASGAYPSRSFTRAANNGHGRLAQGRGPPVDSLAPTPRSSGVNATPPPLRSHAFPSCVGRIGRPEFEIWRRSWTRALCVYKRSTRRS